MSEIKSYLQHMDDAMRRLDRVGSVRLPRAYRGIAELVLRHGRSWSESSTECWPAGEAQQCFANAQRLALLNPELTYVEGYAMSVVPLHHGWCVDRAGRVIDVTWIDRSGVEYFGVPIRTPYVRQRVLRSKFWGSLFDDWQAEPPFAILTGTHKPARWLQPWPQATVPLGT